MYRWGTISGTTFTQAETTGFTQSGEDMGSQFTGHIISQTTPAKTNFPIVLQSGLRLFFVSCLLSIYACFVFYLFLASTLCTDNCIALKNRHKEYIATSAYSAVTFQVRTTELIFPRISWMKICHRNAQKHKYVSTVSSDILFIPPHGSFKCIISPFCLHRLFKATAFDSAYFNRCGFGSVY